MTDHLSSPALTPRVIRLKDAPFYLGVKKDYFNQNIRPYLPVIDFGSRTVAFDRLDLDDYVEHHKRRVDGSVLNPGERVWDKRKYQASSSEKESGILTRKSSENVFAKVHAQVISQKRKLT